MLRRIGLQIALPLVPLAVAAVVLGWMTYTELAARARAERYRRSAHEFQQGVLELAADVNRHRTASLTVLGGDARFEPSIAAFRKQVDAAFARALDAPDMFPAASRTLIEPWDRARDRWAYLRAYHQFRSPDESNEMHARLQADLLAVACRAADTPLAPAAGGRQTLYLAGGIALAGLALSLLLTGLVGRRISRQVDDVAAACEAVETGDCSARVPIQRPDQLGYMAESVNRILDQAEDLQHFREAHDRLQTALLQLLEDVHSLADGDLTREPAESDLPAAFRAGFVNLIHRLRHVIGAVQIVVLQLSTTAKHVQGLVAETAQAGETQAAALPQSMRALDELAVVGQQVGRSATAAAGTVDQATAAARDMNAAARLASQAINSLRCRIDVAARHARRLAGAMPDPAAGVSQFEELARWGSLLARADVASVNGGASTENHAGDLAAKAERLANRATDAARQYAALSALSLGLLGVSDALDEVNRDAVQGTLLAFQAGQAALTADALSQQLARMNTDTANMVRQQGPRVEALNQSLQTVRQGILKNARDGRQAALSVQDLVRLSDELGSALSLFRLPPPEVSSSSVLSHDGTATVAGHWQPPHHDIDEDGEASTPAGVGVEALSDK